MHVVAVQLASQVHECVTLHLSGTVLSYWNNFLNPRINKQHGTHVTWYHTTSHIPIAVVGSWPYSQHWITKMPFIALHHSWWALQIISMLFCELNCTGRNNSDKQISYFLMTSITCATTSWPNKKPAPLGLTSHPWISVIKHNQHITVATRWMAYPQDQTTAGHTLDHHEELLVSYLQCIVWICNFKTQHFVTKEMNYSITHAYIL